MSKRIFPDELHAFAVAAMQKAGLTVVSILGILAFSAFALPMGTGQARLVLRATGR